MFAFCSRLSKFLPVHGSNDHSALGELCHATRNLQIFVSALLDDALLCPSARGLGRFCFSIFFWETEEQVGGFFRLLHACSIAC